MMSKQFNIAYGGNVITDRDGRDLDLTVKWCVEELVDKLNEQQDIIGKLQKENEDLRKQLKCSETTSDATSNYNAFLESKITRLEEENEWLYNLNVLANVFIIKKGLENEFAKWSVENE